MDLEKYNRSEQRSGKGDKSAAHSRSSRPPMVPNGPPVLTPHIEGIYWEKLLNNGYGIPSVDAGVLVMILETHPKLRELKRRRIKRQRTERRIAKTFMGKQRRGHIKPLLRAITAAVLITALVGLVIILLIVVWQRLG